MLVSLPEKEIEIVIGHCFKEFSFDSYVRGFHVYKDIWSPLIGEDPLDCCHEKETILMILL